MMIRTCVAVVALLWLVPALTAAPQLEVVSVRRIWDEAPHSAFGDIIRFRDQWYCVFRDAELTLDIPRAFGEPSLTRFDGRCYLTLRNDVRGYVNSGADGPHFDKSRPWTWDAGSELGNYNTQQHWVTHSAGLFLVYTRRGAGNDHVFRHRAPLFMGQVDPNRLCVIRSTERVLVPQRGARLGNLGVVNVSRDETWVTAAE